jgi:hypothetical protein
MGQVLLCLLVTVGADLGKLLLVQECHYISPFNTVRAKSVKRKKTQSNCSTKRIGLAVLQVGIQGKDLVCGWVCSLAV